MFVSDPPPPSPVRLCIHAQLYSRLGCTTYMLRGGAPQLPPPALVTHLCHAHSLGVWSALRVLIMDCVVVDP